MGHKSGRVRDRFGGGNKCEKQSISVIFTFISTVRGRLISTLLSTDVGPAPGSPARVSPY